MLILDGEGTQIRICTSVWFGKNTRHLNIFEKKPFKCETYQLELKILISISVEASQSMSKCPKFANLRSVKWYYSFHCSQYQTSFLYQAVYSREFSPWWSYNSVPNWPSLFGPFFTSLRFMPNLMPNVQKICWNNLKLTWDSNCSRAGHIPHGREVVSSNPTRSWAFSLLYLISSASLIMSLMEVQHCWFSLKMLSHAAWDEAHKNLKANIFS